jgi:hypothetical protein
MTTNEVNRPTVKLIGADGNVFNILGLCMRAARKAGWPKKRVDEFVGRCTSSGSYDAVLGIVMEEFEVE